MSSYEGKWLTSEFHVKDLEKFEQEMIPIIEEHRIKETGLYSVVKDTRCIGGHSIRMGAHGVLPTLDYGYDQDLPSLIQEHLIEGTTAEISEVGSEGFAYLIAYKLIISKDEIKEIDAGIS